MKLMRLRSCTPNEYFKRFCYKLDFQSFKNFGSLILQETDGSICHRSKPLPANAFAPLHICKPLSATLELSLCSFYLPWSTPELLLFPPELPLCSFYLPWSTLELPLCSFYLLWSTPELLLFPPELPLCSF